MIVNNNKLLELPKGWVWTKLVDSCQYLPTGVPKFNGKAEYYSTGSIKSGSLIQEGTYSFGERPSRANRMARKGDVLQARMAGTNKALLIREYLDGTLFSTGFIQLRPFDFCNGMSSFLYWFIQSTDFLQQRDALATGSTQVALTDSAAKKIVFPLAPLPEQKRIVAKIEELFTKLDAGVVALKKIKAQLKRYRQAVLKHAFEGKLTCKDLSDGLPTGWKQMTLQEVTIEKTGLRRGPFGSTIKKAFFVPEGFKVYEQGNAINDDPYRVRYYISEEKFKELKSFEVLAGDLLVSCSGVTLGRIVYIPDDAEPGIINQALLRIRLKKDILGYKFFIYLFRSEIFQKMIFARSRGTAMPNLIGIKEFRLITITVPPLSEQIKIVDEIERHFSIADQIEQTIEQGLKQSDRLRQSILKKAFEGKLVEQNPEDEPADKLLEQIRAEKGKRQEVKKSKKKAR